MTQTQQVEPACECARLRRAIKEYRRWFDTCTHTSAVKWEEQAANAIDELDAALASPVAPVAPAEDAKPPACDCPARKALAELQNMIQLAPREYPLSASLSLLQDVASAALSAPCPTAELRDEIEQHNLWRAEAYRQIAEKDAAIEWLKEESDGRRRQLLGISDERGVLWRQKENAEARAEKAEAALQAEYERGKRETAAKCAQICDSAAKSCLEWTKCDRSGCKCSACSEQRSMAGACRETAREIRAAFGLDETTGEAVSR